MSDSDIYDPINDLYRQKIGNANGAILIELDTPISGEDSTNDVLRVEEGQFPYELVAASQTAQVLGTTGAAGDLLSAVIVKANTGTITILDGATTFLVIPASTAVGTRYNINTIATTAWKITTPASTEAIGIGRFT